jgi:hypothetical protein
MKDLRQYVFYFRRTIALDMDEFIPIFISMALAVLPSTPTSHRHTLRKTVPSLNQAQVTLGKFGWCLGLGFSDARDYGFDLCVIIAPAKIAHSG